MTNTQIEVLSCIDEIDSIKMESMMDIYNSLSAEYDKNIRSMRYAEKFGIFQEGEILDYATGKNTADSTFMKIIKFVPKLFIAIAKAIGSAITGDKDYTSSLQSAQANLTTMSNDQLAQISSSVNNVSNGEINFDPNKKTFTFVRGLKHVRNIIFIITGLPTAFKSLLKQIKNPSTEYKNMVADLKAILTRKKEWDETSVSLSLDAMNSLLNDGDAAAKSVLAISDEISMALEKRMIKDFENGKNIEKQAKAKELVDQIKTASGTITTYTMITKGIKNVINFLGDDRKLPFGLGSGKSAKDGTGRKGTEKILSTIGRKFLGDDGDSVSSMDIANQEAENKKSRAKSTGIEQTRQNELASHDRSIKRRQHLRDLEDKGRQLEDDISVNTDRYNRTHQAIENENTEYENDHDNAELKRTKKGMKPFKFAKDRHRKAGSEK